MYKSFFPNFFCPPRLSKKHTHAHTQRHTQIWFANEKSVIINCFIGFLGRYLLSYLLSAYPDTHVYCMGRGGWKKFLASITNVDPQFYTRITFVEGDLSKSWLGMTETRFNDLAAKIDWIFHVGAWVNHGTCVGKKKKNFQVVVEIVVLTIFFVVLPYAMLKPSNVEGTIELLRLASRTVHCRFVHISTIGIVQEQEDRRPNLPTARDGGYNQSKFAAESLVWDAMDRGLAGVIVRPGMICGHRVTGHSNRTDSDCRLMAGILQMGVAPIVPEDLQMDMTPVDWVAGVIAWIGYSITENNL